MPFSETRFPERGPRFQRAERRFQRILVGGFAVVLLTLLFSGLVGVFAMRSLGESTQQMSDRYLTQSRLADRLQREQGNVGVLLYNLVREQPNASLEKYREEVSSLRATILGLTKEAATPSLPKLERDAWASVDKAAEPLFDEILRLVQARRNNSEDLSLLHRRFVAETARLMDVSYSDVASDRTQELEHDSGIIRNSQTLLLVSVGVAIFCAALCVLGSLAMFHGLEKQAETLGRLTVHALSEQEEAARRFSQEMHDEFGQTLNAIESTLSAVVARDDVHQERIDDAIALSKDAQSMAREMSQLLRPRILDDFGLDAGLRELALGFSRRTGIAVDYTSGFRERLDPDVETHLFRIAQEALTNTARHTTAKNVEMSLFLKGGLLVLRISDNGGGFTTEGSSSSLGLLGMRERARASGGRLIVNSKSGKGVEVLAEIPFEATHARTEAAPSRSPAKETA